MSPNEKRGQKTREKILKFIVAYIQEHGYPPTIREIGEGVGLYSTATIHNQLHRMYAEGTIETDIEDTYSSRAIRVPGYKFVKENPDE